MTLVEYIDSLIDGADLADVPVFQPLWELRKVAIRLEADKGRLDFLQSQTKGYSKGWILRASSHGRGMRLHETSREGAKPTVREAIDAAMKL